MENAKPRKFVVTGGKLEDHPEDVVVVGVFDTFESARQFIVDEYCALHDVEDPEDNPDLDFTSYCDDGHEFWKIQEVRA